eukprot:CAMPEP_0181326354 /NCGR_PEP_ID=MMETSP1101-20121128/21447_1 /TAXON_ID=46948 /ORGANISM="Rhodomonas abbreviata, Strain Caron Lab Isolate" /LENGTH=78 /DNA_ID=CAMNT_0023434789 /DNA_START=74 /DNA_END=306 /DNA_ORIENTATION=-
MHPPLFREHPDCEQVIQDLVSCHEQNPIAKFLGTCNDAKAALDLCFRKEKNSKRKANMVEANRREEKMNELLYGKNGG